jgi:hypothetical protein
MAPPLMTAMATSTPVTRIGPRVAALSWITAFAAGLATGCVAPASAAPDEAAARLFTDNDNDGGDPAAVVKKIKAEIALGAKGKGRLLMLAAATTDAWGCECPPFVYGPFSSAAEDEGTAYFYPVVNAGPDPGDFQVGTSAGSYELTGRFTKEKLNYAGWLTRRKTKLRAGKDPGGRFKKQQPVFAVERWCFRQADEVNEAYADVIAKMKKAGVTFCK